MDTEFLRGVGAGCGSNPVSRAFPRRTARTPRLRPAPSSPQQVRVRPVHRAEGSGNQVSASLCTRGRTAPEWLSLGRPARHGRHARHSKAVGGFPHAPSTRLRGCTGPLQGGPRAVVWQAPLGFSPRHGPPRFPPGLVRPVTAGPVSVKTGRPRTPRAAALSGSWRPVSPEAQPGGATAARPPARLGGPGTVPPRHSPSGAPTAASGTGVSDGGSKGLTVTQTVNVSGRAARATHHRPIQGSGRGARHYASKGPPARQSRQARGAGGGPMSVQMATRTRAKSGRANARSLYEGRWGSPALGGPAKCPGFS
jgi:hypothetical protein